MDEEHGQSLQNVRIVALPASGTVMLGGTAVTAGESVAKGDLDAGRLTYTQPGTDPEDASFTFKVSDGTAESDGPYTMDIEVRSPAPGPPENLTAAAGDGAATLGWEAPANSGASAIVRYEVRHAAANSVPMNTAWQSVGLTLSHSITGLTNGQVYTFEVRAVNGSNPAEGPAAEVRATPAPVVSITPGFLSVAEDAGEAVLTVSLHRPAESALSVSWHTQDERADAPNDYTARQEAVTFAAGEDRKTISVPIVDDAVREDPVHDVHETFFVILQAGQGYSRSDSSYALVEIVDNDGDALGDVTPPRLLQRTVNGTTLVLTYDETLDDASVPAPGDFVVQSGGNTINVSQVSVDGSKVTLTLAAPVQPSQAVSIDYTPGANPIQDASGNDAAPLSGTDVTAAAAHPGGGERGHAGADLRRDARRRVGPFGGRLRRDGGGEHDRCQRCERGRLGGDADAGRARAGEPDGDARLHAGSEPDPGHGGERRGGALRTGRDQQHSGKRRRRRRRWRWRWPLGAGRARVADDDTGG